MKNLEESKDPHIPSPLHPSLNDLKAWRPIQKQIATLLNPNNKQSLLSAFQPFLNLLLELNACKSLEEKFKEPTIKAFFINKFLPTGMTSILKCKMVDNAMVEDVLNSCLRQMILLWSQNPSEEHSGLGEMAVKTLNPIQPYYTHLLRDQSSPASLQNTNGGSLVFDDIFKSLKDQNVSGLIIDVVSDKDRSVSLEFLVNICRIVCNISDALPGYLDIGYINKIRDAIMDKLVLNTGSLTVSFTEKSIRVALKAFALLLKKSFYPSTRERHRATDILRLQISKMALDSDDLKNKRLGLKLIVDVVETIEDPQAHYTKSLSREALNEFLQRMSPQFFKFCKDDSLFVEFFQKSRGIFLYLLEQNLVNSSWARRIINILKGPNYSESKPCDWLFGGPCRPIIEKLFSREHAKPLFEWIISKGFPNGPEDASALDAEVLAMIFQVSLTRDLFGTSVANFIWEILIHSKKISEPSLFKRVGDVYIHLMKRRGQFQFETTMQECINNIKQDITNPRFFRIIGYLSAEINDICQKFFREKQILSLFMNDIRLFKKQNTPIVNEEDYVAQVSERIYCIEGLFNFVGDREQGMITYDILAELWDKFVEHPSVSIERDLMYSVIYETAGTWIGLLIKSDILIKFYREKILCEEGQQYLRSSKEGAACFRGFFITMNEDLNKIWRSKVKYSKSSEFLVKVFPEELEGYNELWKLIMSFEHEKAKEEAMDFLISIYSSLEDSFEKDLVSIRERYLDICFGYLRLEKLSDDGCFRSLKLIEKMMDESEKYGIGELLTHNRLLKSEMIQLRLFLWKECEPSQLNLSVKSNDTVFDLLKEVAKHTKTAWDGISLFRYPYSPQEIPRAQIGQTLAEIGIKRYECLNVTKREIPQADLFRGTNCLSLRARKVLVDLFEEYSDNGKMSQDEFLTFVNERIQARPHRMFPGACSRVFSEYDLDRRGYLTIDNFLDYYLYVCKTSPYEVRNHMQALGKRKDLHETSEITKKQATISRLVSYIVASRSEDVKLLFSFLDKKDEIAYQTWKLLSRMPTCPGILKDVLTLQGMRGVEDGHQRDWNSLLNLESKYRILYALNVVEYLICYDRNPVQIPFIEEDIKLKEYQQTWRRDFIDYGGLDHLEKIRDAFRPEDDAISRVLCKRVLMFMRTVGNELDSQGHDMGKEDNLLRFKEALCEYERDFLAMEHRIAANMMKRTILKLKMK